MQFCFKGDVDPDSDVVNLLESMYVDEGSRHNQHVSNNISQIIMMYMFYKLFLKLTFSMPNISTLLTVNSSLKLEKHGLENKPNFLFPQSIYILFFIFNLRSNLTVR